MFLIKHNNEYRLYDETGSYQNQSWEDRPDTAELRFEYGKIRFRNVDRHGDSEVPLELS